MGQYQLSGCYVYDCSDTIKVMNRVWGNVEQYHPTWVGFESSTLTFNLFLKYTSKKL